MSIAIDFYNNVVDLPKDLMIEPVHAAHSIEGTNTRICHSDSEKKWYVLLSFEHNDCHDRILAEGSFSDIVQYCAMDIYTVPFIWGDPIPHKEIKILQYIPYWQSVPTGETDEEGFDLYEQHYYLLKIYQPYYINKADNKYNFNGHTSFETIEYGTDITRLIKDLGFYTGKVF